MDVDLSFRAPRRSHANPLSSATRSLGMWCRDVVTAYFNRLTGRTIETKYFGRRVKAWNGADNLARLSAFGA